MNIYVCFDIKNSIYDELIDDYITRIKRYSNISLINTSKEYFESYKQNNTYFINVVDNKSSKQISSVDFANKIDKILINGINNIVFFDKKNMYQNANINIAISNMNVSSDLERLLLLEQIYRSFKINNNETYHK